MANAPLLFDCQLYFDFIDPVSYLLELELRRVEPSLAGRVERIGFELVPPPAPLTSVDDPRWSARWAEARPLAERRAVRLDPPRLVPWTRKAHELHTLAREHGKVDEARMAIFSAYFDGEDIGRVDRLVEIAVSLGLDRTTTKAVLDVDRHEADVVRARGAGVALGVSDVPTMVVRGRLVRAFHNREDLGTLLRGA
jgi:predicted DsbA family dithiol-disulfide isomerase